MCQFPFFLSFIPHIIGIIGVKYFLQRREWVELGLAYSQTKTKNTDRWYKSF